MAHDAGRPQHSRYFLLFSIVLGAAALPAYGQPAASTNSAPLHATASADQSPGHGWGVRLGFQDHYRNATLVYETPTWWSYRFQSGWGRLALNAELGVSYWTA